MLVLLLLASRYSCTPPTRRVFVFHEGWWVCTRWPLVSKLLRPVRALPTLKTPPEGAKKPRARRPWQKRLSLLPARFLPSKPTARWALCPPSPPSAQLSDPFKGAVRPSTECTESSLLPAAPDLCRSLSSRTACCPVCASTTLCWRISRSCFTTLQVIVGYKFVSFFQKGNSQNSSKLLENERCC